MVRNIFDVLCAQTAFLPKVRPPRPIFINPALAELPCLYLLMHSVVAVQAEGSESEGFSGEDLSSYITAVLARYAVTKSSSGPSTRQGLTHSGSVRGFYLPRTVVSLRLDPLAQRARLLPPAYCRFSLRLDPLSQR